MQTSSPLPPGFGFDPTELGTSVVNTGDATAGMGSLRPSAAPGEAPDARPVPTLWIGSDGSEEDDAADATPSRSPGSIVMMTACMGIALAALAYALDFPLS